MHDFLDICIKSADSVSSLYFELQMELYNLN